jgi:hypothetical protein
VKRATRVLSALAAVGVLLVPSARALADNNEPEPTEWPTVVQPQQDGQSSEPEPTDWPTVVQR